MLEVIIIAACLETSEGCNYLSDFYFKHKGYDQIYDAFSKKYKREIELAGPGITLVSVAVERTVKFKYRPFTFAIKEQEARIGFNYDF